MSGMLFGSSNCAISDAGKATKVLFCHGDRARADGENQEKSIGAPYSVKKYLIDTI